MPTPLMSRKQGVLGKSRRALQSLVAALAAFCPGTPRPLRCASDCRRRGRREGSAMRGEHFEREEGRLAQSLAVLGGGEPAAAGQRDGERRSGRWPRLYPDQPSRCGQSSGNRRARCSTGRRTPARVLQYDAVMDLAVLKVDADHTLAAIADRHFIGPDGRRDGDHDRQRIRLREHRLRGDHQRACIGT